MTREFWAVDCETDPFKYGRVPQPFIFGAYNGDDYLEFDTATELTAHFYNQEVVLYAHNGGKFDWHFVLPDLEPETKIQVISGRLAKFKIGEAEYRDSYSLLPIPLSAWQKDVFDYEKLEKENREKHREEIRRYLRSDCVNLYDILVRFFASYGRKLTLASASLAMWRKISGETEDHSSPEFYEEIKPFYYGGRVQCFKSGVGEHAFQVVDINSAYPRAMLSRHPWGTLYFTDVRLPKAREDIERCFITITAKSTGAFPYRGENGLEFPSDHQDRSFNITGWEYLAAVETGTLDAGAKVHLVHTFADSINFEKYINHFFHMKADAKERMKNPDDLDAKADYIFAKLFMNSLYGKFASDPSSYSEYMTCLPDEIEAMESEELGGWELVAELHNVAIVGRSLPPQAQRYFNVAVGASITGYVRAMLWRAIQASEGVLYCDTDSIAAIKPVVELGDEIGQWSNEGDFNRWAIAGKKLYAFGRIDGGYKIASKGARLTAEQIFQIADGETVEYKQEAPTFGLRGVRFTARNIKRTK